MHTYIYTHIYTETHTYTLTSMYTFTETHTYRHMCTCVVQTYTQTHMCRTRRTDPHTYVLCTLHVQTHTNTCPTKTRTRTHRTHVWSTLYTHRLAHVYTHTRVMYIVRTHLSPLYIRRNSHTYGHARVRCTVHTTSYTHTRLGALGPWVMETSRGTGRSSPSAPPSSSTSTVPIRPWWATVCPPTTPV